MCFRLYWLFRTLTFLLIFLSLECLDVFDLDDFDPPLLPIDRSLGRWVGFLLGDCVGTLLGCGVTVLVVGLVGPFEGEVVGGDQLCGGGDGSVVEDCVGEWVGDVDGSFVEASSSLS